MDTAGWIAYNLEKFERCKAVVAERELRGVTFAQTGPHETTFLMSCTLENGQIQRITTGRIAIVTALPYTGPKGASEQTGYRDEEVVDGGENMPLAEMLKVLEAWTGGRMYEDPPF